MATPRHLLVDPENECDYHLVSRCVRPAFLCGVDDHDGRDYSHRRGWLVERMRQLSPCFAVDIYAYTVLSNHFHLVMRHDPLAHRAWSDEEVAWRCFDAFPPSERGAAVEELKPERRELMLGDPKRVARARCTLGSMSHFMKHLKQPVARRANLEDDRTGHFFEQRFYSGALLTEEALVAAMAYVDLNPVRAELAQRIEEIRDTSICDRLLENSAEALADYLRPVLSGLDGRPAQAGASPIVVAGVGPSFAAAAETPVPQPATDDRQPDGDAGEPDPAHAGDAETDAADATPSGTSPAPESDPGNRPLRPSRLPRPQRHAGAVHRTRPRHGRGGERAFRQCPGPGRAVAGADEGAPQAAARIRQRGRTAALDRRPGHAAPGNSPARLTPRGRRARRLQPPLPRSTGASWDPHPHPCSTSHSTEGNASAARPAVHGVGPSDVDLAKSPTDVGTESRVSEDPPY
ncbi:MAG: hypothetical protein F4029_18210 [Gammaproteobacteria bacterium]|nr:hypothetical protein [Gammaproteobacteria bacterium]